MPSLYSGLRLVGGERNARESPCWPALGIHAARGQAPVLASVFKPYRKARVLGYRKGNDRHDHKRTVEKMSFGTEAMLKLLHALEVDEAARAKIVGDGNAVRIFRNTAAGGRIVNS